MRLRLVLAVCFTLLMVGLQRSSASAQEPLPLPPPEATRPSLRVDPFIAIYGGMAFPTKTNAQVDGTSSNTHFTVTDQTFSNSKTLGGKIGLWSPSLRERTGLDYGFALDFTSFQPDIKSGRFRATGISNGTPVSAITWLNKVDVDSLLFTVNLLFRIPLYISEEFPNGRFYPYGGGGIGVQSTSIYSQDRNKSDFGTQALAGLNFFLTKRVAMFTEYKYTYAKQTLEFATSNEQYIFAVHHAVFGLAIHFGP